MMRHYRKKMRASNAVLYVQPRRLEHCISHHTGPGAAYDVCNKTLECNFGSEIDRSSLAFCGLTGLHHGQTIFNVVVFATQKDVFDNQ
jgi:hypothetical protein